MPRTNCALFLVALGFLAACGGGGGDAPTGPPTSTPTPPPPPAPPPPPPPASQLLCPPGGEITLAIGEQLILRNQSTYCMNFAASGTDREYLLGVQSVGEGGVALRNITVSGDVVETTAAQAAPPALQRAAGTLSPLDVMDRPEFRLLREHRQAHQTMMERDIRSVASLLSRGARAPAQESPVLGVVTGDEEVGDMVDLRVRRVDLAGCEEPATTTITAELKIKNPESMFFVDIENPGPGFTDEELQELADLFDTHIYGVETAQFGAVNDQDGNGRVVIVITQAINVANGDGQQVLGFVNPCGFFSREEVFASNEGEYFYSIAPDTDGTVGQPIDRDFLLGFLPLIIAHEFTHVIQNSHRFTQEGELMAPFMAEGQATLAEEVVGHSILGNSVGQNYGAEVAVDLENSPFPFWYLNPWSDLTAYFGFPGNRTDPSIPGTPQECTWTAEGEDDPCLSRPLWYGVTWSFLRWASDQFGEDFGGEDLLQQELIRNDVAGFDNLRDVLSPYGLLEDLLAQWSATFYMDGHPAQSDPRHNLASWDYSSAVVKLIDSAWLYPTEVGFTDFTESVRVRDPSTAYFLVGGGIAPQFALKVEGAGGGTLSSDIQVWLVRTK